jgi:hypothetical protein
MLNCRISFTHEKPMMFNLISTPFVYKKSGDVVYSIFSDVLSTIIEELYFNTSSPMILEVILKE